MHWSGLSVATLDSGANIYGNTFKIKQCVVRLAPSADLPNHIYWEWDLSSWFALALASRPESPCREVCLLLWQAQVVSPTHWPHAPVKGWSRVGKLQPHWAPPFRREGAFSDGVQHWVPLWGGLARWLLALLRPSGDTSDWMIMIEQVAPGQLSLTNKMGRCSQPITKMKWSTFS